MPQRTIQTSKRLSAERQIHAAIAHFRAGEFECAITLCSAAEGQLPEPSVSGDLFRILQKHVKENPPPDGNRDDFNYVANWMKHSVSPDEVQIDEWIVKFWLNRAISKYWAVFGVGTTAMAALFPWAGTHSR